MKVKFLPEVIVNTTESEESLSEQSHLEAFYEMRKLKVGAFFGSDKICEVNKINSSKQIYVEEFQIWISENCYIVVED